MSNGRYSLYGTSFSLFTGKVRAYLRKKGIPFDEVHATARVYKKFIVPKTGVRFIPVLQTPEGKVFQDTTVIIDELEKRFPDSSVYPKTAKQRLVALLLETYADEWLVIPAMHYRWNFDSVNQPYIYQQFGSVVSPKLPSFIRRRIGKRLGDRFRGFVPLLGITQQTMPAIEKSYQALLADLNTHFEDHEFLLGSRPSIADFGLIGPMYAHLYLDPYPGEIMRRTAPRVTAWVERMMSKQPSAGEYLGGDEIPATLMPILQRMAREQLPVLLATDKLLKKWRRKNPNLQIPRSIGQQDFSIEGVVEKRLVFPYSLWMFKRSVDFYRSQPIDQQRELDQLIKPLGFGDSLELGLSNDLIRENNQLKFAG